MIWNDTNKPIFILAPMDDVTDTVFRQIIASTAAPDIYFTEFVSVDGLMSQGREAVKSKLQFTDVETPLVAQVWGLKPENYEAVAAELADQGYAGIDINMGCPVNVVVKNGACSALINNRELAGEIIAATKRGAAGKIPVSVKTRIGFDEIDRTWAEFLLNQGIDALTIHGRTRKQMSKVPNNWEEIGAIRQMRDDMGLKTAIIGNGDIVKRSKGEEIAQQYGLDGIMIGRGIFKDPYVFAVESPWKEMSTTDKLELYKKHIRLFIETWADKKKNPAMLKKFAKVYVNGFDGASSLRVALMARNTAEGLIEELELYNSSDS